MTMMHAGLPVEWLMLVAGFMFFCIFRQIFQSGKLPSLEINRRWHPWTGVTVFRRMIQSFLASHGLILAVKLIAVFLFVLVIVTGLYGTPIPERNFAPVLTWTLWWTLLIFAILFVGNSWCAVCPWDALATWLVRFRWWKRGNGKGSLNFQMPRMLRNIWAALLMLVGLTWLEIGVGVTLDPYATASLALVMLLLATLFQAVFERKAFCRYVCPVGRTIGFYSQLLASALRPKEKAICDTCKTIECYRGTADIPPCPTHLVLGRMSQSADCLSCGHCVQSCPNENVEWGRQSAMVERTQLQTSEAFFILVLLSLTSLHGMTMTAKWDAWISSTASMINDSGMLLGSFTLGLVASIVVPLALYCLAAFIITRLQTSLVYMQVFSGLAYITLPLAFSYHLAHNLVHLVREVASVGDVLVNPFGTGTLPLSIMEKHMRMSTLIMPEWMLFAMQSGLMVFGFWLALNILRQRTLALFPAGQLKSLYRMWPMLLFITIAAGYNLCLLGLPMIMRI